ncbi:chitobiosyldiphosphodolichol beta-mannosyltransferase [Malassezia obtusa]|uniref:Chitobiosyldiphosphodolichol beta-mannosyltransferase n=1 Tax=Malassezia obtusa TaxID=76774 RepID=A0AAF0IRX0_9BASI|nr:chitobiosyldiphosphodolichol beta-mannosyltransferase [Malassezia obtusa]
MALLALLAAAAAALLVVYAVLARRDASVAAVVVVGDVARSPRMCYHATSLLQHGWTVRLLGYFDTPLPAALQTPRVQRVALYRTPDCVARWPRALFPLVALVKVPLVALSLFAALALRASPAVVVVQTPPAIPTLLVARIATVLSGARLIIDWHNLGYTILALKLGAAHPLVSLAARLEAWSGRTADAHLFVTRAMRDTLCARWRLRGAARVLYDRPGPQFRRIDAAERAALRARFAREGHALVITSTSWTPDEDMDVLLDAASTYERLAQAPRARLPPLAVVITGKGPLRATYEARFAARARDERWTHVGVSTAWLAAEDYPRLLGCADVGVSLHRSSSDLDLPMKVVDLLGCRAAV